MGRPDNPQVINDVMKENDIYHDIVMEDFRSHYNNMTYSALGAFKWILLHCPNVRYILKSDDDVYVNVAEVINELYTKYVNSSRFILCMLYHNMPILRDKPWCAKWCVDRSYLPGKKYYPEYCSGSAYFFTKDIIHDMYNASLHAPYFFIDDAFVTGIIRQKVKPKITAHSFEFKRASFFDGDLEAMIKNGKVFPTKFIVHNVSKRNKLMGEMLAENVKNLPANLRTMIDPKSIESIRERLLKEYNITLTL